MNFYTSDTHFGCQYIFDRTGRASVLSPDISEADQKIIDNFNERLSKNDTLYILGDLSSADVDPTPYLEKIKGKKILVIGNHDAKWLRHRHVAKLFKRIEPYMGVREFGKELRIVLSHYPLAEWDGYYKGHLHFYGHVHNSDSVGALRMKDELRAANVGVDVHDFKPMTAAELFARRVVEKGIDNEALIQMYKGFEKDLTTKEYDYFWKEVENLRKEA